MSTSEGRKDDAGKAPWHLVPFDAVGCIVKVLQFGAKKYAPRNWEKGMDWGRPFDACIRHLTSWWHGERADPETGFSHLWHAGCCIVFLIAYELRGIGRDDRPSLAPKVEAGSTTVFEVEPGTDPRGGDPREPERSVPRHPRRKSRSPALAELEKRTNPVNACGTCGAMFVGGPMRPAKCADGPGPCAWNVYVAP